MIFVAVACFIPFLGKAFFIDDTLFLRNAQFIVAHPADFFGATLNWYGTPAPMSEITRNPPGACYFAALAGLATGWREVGMHLFFLLPALATLALVAGLARLAGASAVGAGLLTLATPAFLISGSNIMSDMAMTAWWCGAVYCWVRGHRDGRLPWFLAGGLCAALGFLTKYYGFAVIFLLAAYSLLTDRRLGRWAWGLLIPVAAIVGYEWLTRRLYGRGLFLESALYATRHASAKIGPLAKTLLGVEFFGGCLFPLLFVAPLLGKPRALLGLGGGLLAIGAAAVAGGLAFAGALVAGIIYDIHWLMFFLAGGLMLIFAATAVRRKDPLTVVLCLWIWGTFVFTTFANWTISGRNFLTAGPAVALLVAIELRERLTPRRLAAIVAPALVFSLWIAHADFAVANAQRELARATDAEFGATGASLEFMGHWGWQVYMEQSGHTPLDLANLALAPGTLVAVPINNTNVIVPPTDRFRLVAALHAPVAAWAMTTSWPRSIGFYSTQMGPLPFAFARPPDEEVRIYRAE